MPAENPISITPKSMTYALMIADCSLSVSAPQMPKKPATRSSRPLSASLERANMVTVSEPAARTRFAYSDEEKKPAIATRWCRLTANTIGYR